MKINTLLAAVLWGFLLSACSKDISAVNDLSEDGIRPLHKNEKFIAESDTKFGLNLFRQIAAAQPDSNIFISPLSTSMALGMTLNGAAGGTYEDMKNTLALNGLSEDEINAAYRSLIDLLLNLDENVIFQIANSIWCEQNFQPEQSFLDISQQYFDAETASLNFSSPEAVSIINSWVSDKTNGMIEEILDYIPANVVMYLINAIYFKGSWQYEFNPDNTETAQFITSGGRPAECRMMKIAGLFKYYQDDQVQVVELPYGSRKFCMTILLPAVSVDINSFTADLNKSRWQHYLNSLKSDSGQVKLPKFKVEYKLKMNNVLTAMGMGSAFDPARADFTRITSGGGIWINRVLHKTFIQVDEEGTEASAATVVEMIKLSGDGPDYFYMHADRPFIYIIRERNSDTILFLGKMMKPEWDES